MNIVEYYIAKDYIPSLSSSFNSFTTFTFSLTTSPSGGSAINLYPNIPSSFFKNGSDKDNFILMYVF